MKKHTIALGLLPLFLTACDVPLQSEYSQEYVVESYLVALEPMPALHLSRTAPAGTAYIFEELAVSDAAVELQLLSPDGSAESSIPYREQEKGIYQPVSSQTLVLPRRTYALNISFENDATIIKSQTVVPDTFSFTNETADSIIYQSEDRLKLDITSSFSPDRQNIFLFSFEAKDVSFDQLTPFIKDIFDEETDSLDEFRINESPIINENNYDRNPNGTLTIKIPWLAIVFYGETDIIINALDDNFFDFVRSQEIQTNGRTLSPGEITNVIDNIEGGAGIFASMARQKTTVFINRE